MERDNLLEMHSQAQALAACRGSELESLKLKVGVLLPSTPIPWRKCIIHDVACRRCAQVSSVIEDLLSEKISAKEATELLHSLGCEVEYHSLDQDVRYHSVASRTTD